MTDYYETAVVRLLEFPNCYIEDLEIQTRFLHNTSIEGFLYSIGPPRQTIQFTLFTLPQELHDTMNRMIDRFPNDTLTLIIGEHDTIPFRLTNSRIFNIDDYPRVRIEGQVITNIQGDEALTSGTIITSEGTPAVQIATDLDNAIGIVQSVELDGTVRVAMAGQGCETKPYPKLKQEFAINDYITLKLEKEKTNIYVKGKKFDQCKFLMLNLKKGEEYEDIESIDDAAKKLNGDMEHDHSLVTPEEEFWGHCSNLQAWVENDYDLRIIHSNLGFPLAIKLLDCGEKKARMAIVEEVTSRVLKNPTNAIPIVRKYLQYFKKEELQALVDELKRDETYLKHLVSKDLGISSLKGCAEAGLNRINGGMGEDNDVSASGDLMATIMNVLRRCNSEGFGIIRLQIQSSLAIYALAQGRVIIEDRMTEMEQIERLAFLTSWDTRLTENKMIFIAEDVQYNTFMFETGELSW